MVCDLEGRQTNSRFKFSMKRTSVGLKRIHMCVKYCFESDSNYKDIYQFGGSEKIEFI